MKKYLTSSSIKSVATALTLLGFGLVSQQSFASSYDFTRITNNATVNIASQLLVDVTEATGGALFTFRNNIGIASSITDIYFDAGSNTGLFSNIAVFSDSGAGVSFDNNPSPSNLPGGNTVGFTSDFGGDAVGSQANGVNTADEWVSFLGVYNTGSYTGLLSALAAGSFRIGLHVQGIGGITSDAYVSSTPLSPPVSTVPVPAAAWLFASALLGWGAASRRRKA